MTLTTSEKPGNTVTPGDSPYTTSATSTTTTTTTSSTWTIEDSGVRTGIASLYVVQGLLTVAGNGMVLFVVCRSSLHRHMPSAGLAINIAMSDMVLATALLFHAFLLLAGSDGSTHVYRAWCMACARLMIFGSLAVQLSLLLIVAERYVAINHPFLYPKVMRTRTVRLAAAAMWGYSLLLAFFSLLPPFSHVEVTNDFCLAGDVLNKEYVLLFVAHFLVLTLVSLIANASITFIACRQNARVQHADNSTRSSLTDTSTTQPRLVEDPLSSHHVTGLLGVANSLRPFPSQSQEVDDSVFFRSREDVSYDRDPIEATRSLNRLQCRDVQDSTLDRAGISSRKSGLAGAAESASYLPLGPPPTSGSTQPATSQVPECRGRQAGQRQRTLSTVSVNSEYSSLTFRAEESVAFFRDGGWPSVRKEAAVTLAATSSTLRLSQHHIAWLGQSDSAVEGDLLKNDLPAQTPGPRSDSSRRARTRVFSFEQDDIAAAQSSANDSVVSLNPCPLPSETPPSQARTLKTPTILGPRSLSANLLQVPSSTRHQRLLRRFKSSTDMPAPSCVSRQQSTMTAYTSIRSTLSTARRGRISLQAGVKRTFVLLKHSGLLALLFSLSWFPFVIVELLELAGYPQSVLARRVAPMFIFITPVTNPVIYVWGNASFRSAFVKIIRRRRRTRVVPAAIHRVTNNKLTTITDSHM